MSRLGIVAIDETATTARYFERAAAALGHELVMATDARGLEAEHLNWLLLVDPFVAEPDRLRRFECPVIGYVIDAHQQLAPRLAYAKYLDHVFIAQPDYMPHFAGMPHASAHWLPLGCDPEIHFASGHERSIEVAFVGKLGHPGSDRHATLARVLNMFPTNDWKKHYAPQQMGETYSRAKIVFNKSINADLNMRFFEGLAAGALLITDRIGNGLDSIGHAGEHYVVYDTADEAIDKIRYFLAHDVEREAIARAGQKLVFAEHTYRHRLHQMLEVVESHREARAPARIASPAVEALWRSERMRMNGTTLTSGLALFAEGRLAPPVVSNVVVGMARGIARPLRQRIQTFWRRAGSM